MRSAFGTTDIPTAGSAVQLSNTKDKVMSIAVHAPRANSGNIFFGYSDVSSTNGWTLEPGDALDLDYGGGSVLFSNFYADTATNGDDIQWAVVLL